MISIQKAFLLAMIGSVQASPLASTASSSEDSAATQDWTPPVIPEGAIDISNNTALVNELRIQYGLEVAEEASSNAGGITIMSGACDQGTCPDYDRAFDTVFTWIAIPQPGVGGAPPTTLFWMDNDMRVNDCGQCYRKKIGSGSPNSGGCWDLTACNRPQSICVDGNNRRAHRIWKDNNVKKCYRMAGVALGGCGNIQDRFIWRPEEEVACNW